MATLEKLSAEEIKDSRGEPTIRVTLKSSDGSTGIASIPSGRSKSTHEACALTPVQAIKNIELLDGKMHGLDISEIRELDTKMKELDGTTDMSNLGANAILGTSIAAIKAAAASKKIETYRHIGDLVGRVKFSISTPIFNVINGGKHAKNNLKFQEFSIVPVGFERFSQKLEAGKKIFAIISEILEKDNIKYDFGDEGGFSPYEIKDYKALDYLTDSIEKAGYMPGEEIKIGLDIAASSIVDFNGAVDSYLKLVSKYPIIILEDPFPEDSWHSWTELNLRLKNDKPELLLVGDDIFATNLSRLQQGIESNTANSIIVKPNQCGTVSEVLSVVMMAKENDYQIVVSHRSGETEDDFISDLAVGVGAEYIKAGAPNEKVPERMNKYKRLVDIEEQI